MGVVFVFGLAGLACGSSPVATQETGLEGQVVRGPTAGGPVQEGDAGQEPFSALFHVLDSEERGIAQFRSDENGMFEVALAPGDYIVVPDDSAPIFLAHPVRGGR